MCWCEFVELKPLHIASRNVQCCGRFKKQFGRPSNSLTLSYHMTRQSIPLLIINPRELKRYVHVKPCRWMLIAELIKEARKVGKTKYLSIDEQINKMVCMCVYTYEYYSAIKLNDVLIYIDYNMDEACKHYAR